MGRSTRGDSTYFSRQDLQIFKARLYEDNGGTFIGNRPQVAKIRGEDPEFNRAWERMEEKKSEKYGENEWNKLPEGKKHTQLINILRKTITRGQKK